MNKYLLIILIAGISFYLFTKSKKNHSKQKRNINKSKIGETSVFKTKKNKAKVKLDAVDVKFEEIKKND